MRRFLVQVCLFLFLLVASSLGVLTVRFANYAEEVETTMKLEPWQKILFIGDSHIGCTFIQNQQYENCVLWESSMPQQFTLMRLREMEKRGALNGVELIVLDIGLQSIGQQRVKRMKEFWWRMLPISIRHSDVLPLSIWDKIDQFVKKPNGRIHVRESMPTADVSVLTRTRESREADFQKTAETHFEWINRPTEMCCGWNDSLKCAIDEISLICKRNDIPLVFITAPLTSYYVEAIPKEVNEKLREYTDQIAHNGIPYYDLRNWGEDDDFRDCFHFRYSGAMKFTEWFYKEIIPLHRKRNPSL